MQPVRAVACKTDWCAGKKRHGIHVTASPLLRWTVVLIIRSSRHLAMLAGGIKKFHKYKHKYTTNLQLDVMELPKFKPKITVLSCTRVNWWHIVVVG